MAKKPVDVVDEGPAYPLLALNPPLNITFIEKLGDMEPLLEFLDENKIFGWDLETPMSATSFYNRCIRTMQFGNRERQFVVDLLGIVGGDSKALCTQGHYGKNLDERLREFFDMVAPYLCDQKKLKVGVNLGFEYQNCYWNAGIRAVGFYDNMLVDKAIWAGAHPLQDYPFFGMNGMIEHYFHKSISKELQSSFTIGEPLTQSQIEYAALDTRLPLMLKFVQDKIIRGDSRSSLPEYVFCPGNVCGDDLRKTVQIQNDAIGMFAEMHIHGDAIDAPRWTKKIHKREGELVGALAELDKQFIPFVGENKPPVTDEEIVKAGLAWKSIKLTKTMLPEQKELRNKLKAYHTSLKQQQSAFKKLSGACQGTALINYNSWQQLLKVLKQVPVMATLKHTDEDTLIPYENIPIVAALLTYRGIAKELSTYGMTWVQKWVNEPPNKKTNKETGWLNPWDGKLHPQYHQYDTETNRSSSSGPNGQNLPHDEETRACFIAEPEDDGEERVILTIDMSGAELRILAEESKDPIWIECFNKGQDVHCLGCEIVDPETWFKIRALGGEKVMKKGKEVVLPECAYFKLGLDGKAQRVKCACPAHNERRNDFKPVNFGIAYGLGPSALSIQIRKPKEYCKETLKSHRGAFPVLWAHIDWSGKQALENLKAFDMFGCRRLFREVSYEQAIKFAQDHPDEETGEPMTIKEAFRALQGMTEREGKNHPIQSGNASIAKLALGAGFDKNGKPFLWHIVAKYKARILGLIHDEFKFSCLKSNAAEFALVVKDAIKRAAAERMHLVEMESAYVIAPHWAKPE